MNSPGPFKDCWLCWFAAVGDRDDPFEHCQDPQTSLIRVSAYFCPVVFGVRLNGRALILAEVACLSDRSNLSNNLRSARTCVSDRGGDASSRLLIHARTSALTAPSSSMLTQMVTPRIGASVPCNRQGPMNIQKELHTLVHEPDGSPAKQQLHTLVDDLHEEQAREPLTRLRELRRRSVDNHGFYVTSV